MKRFKQSVIIGVIIALLLSVVCSVLFLKFGTDFVVNKYNQTSIYSETCDFIIPSPGDGQVSELENKAFIDKVIPFYFTKSQVKHNNKSATENIVMVDGINDLEHTVYNSKRLIGGALEEHGVFIDYVYAKGENVKVGDKLSITFGTVSYEYVVSAIFESNSIYEGGAIAVNWSAEEKSAVKASIANKLRYSGAWVSCSDYAACKSFLSNEYKPLGRLKERDEFDSDSAYQIHLQSFNGTNWTLEITDFAETLKFEENKTNGAEAKAAIFYLFAVLLPLLFVAIKVNVINFTKKVKQTTKKLIVANGANKRGLLKLGYAEILSALGGGLLVYILFFVIYCPVAQTFVRLSLLTVYLSVAACVFIVAAVIILITFRMHFLKTYKDIKAKN